MWKFDIYRKKINLNISVDQIINWVEIYDGTFLFTSDNSFFNSNLNIVGLNPVIRIYPNHSIFADNNITKENFEVIDNLISHNKSDDFINIRSNICQPSLKLNMVI